MLKLLLCCSMFVGTLVCVAKSPTLKPCRVGGIRNEVLCGSVQRALNPARPDDIKVDVHYIVVPATARRKRDDPVFLLPGGPGQSAIALAHAVMPLLARLNNRRDLVFVDQRGTGRSAPLSCPEKRTRPVAELADPRMQERLLLQCRDKLAQLSYVGGLEGLRYFTTILAMQDLEAVRRQLGSETINLVGVSYGTRAALEYLRQYPDNVRRAVMDGVTPPNMVLPASVSPDTQAVFDALLKACEDDSVCAKRHPRLHADWVGLLKGLPKEVSVVHPLTGEHESLTLTRDMLLSMVRSALYAPNFAAALPVALAEATRGRMQPLLGLSVLLTPRRANTLAKGLHFSVLCSEDVPRLALASDRPGADFGDSFTMMYERVCAAWPRAQPPDGFYKIPASNVPVLLLSGGLDPVTPPRHGDRVAKALGAKARHVVVANAGHGVLSLPCARDVLFRFLDADSDSKAAQVDTACMTRVPRPPSFVPVQPIRARND